jgi:hypothetical protein
VRRIPVHASPSAGCAARSAVIGIGIESRQLNGGQCRPAPRASVRARHGPPSHPASPAAAQRTHPAGLPLAVQPQSTTLMAVLLPGEEVLQRAAVAQPPRGRDRGPCTAPRRGCGHDHHRCWERQTFLASSPPAERMTWHQCEGRWWSIRRASSSSWVTISPQRDCCNR